MAFPGIFLSTFRGGGVEPVTPWVAVTVKLQPVRVCKQEYPHFRDFGIKGLPITVPTRFRAISHHGPRTFSGTFQRPFYDNYAHSEGHPELLLVILVLPNYFSGIF